MRRLLLIGMIIVTFAAGAGVMQLKYAVGQRVDRMEAIARKIAEDQEDIRVLEAELAHMMTPERLHLRATRHLALMPPRPDQIIATPLNIPLRLQPARMDQKRQQSSHGSGGDR